MKILSILRTALFSLLIGWLSAGVLVGSLVLLQYQEVVRYFPADQVTFQFQVRLDREVWHGALLLLVQVGIVGGALWWLLARQSLSSLAGLVCGGIVALVEVVAGWWLGVPTLFLVPFAFSLLVIGYLANFPSNLPTIPTKTV